MVEINASGYWKTIAPSSAAARTLADSLSLKFSGEKGYISGLEYPIRRLILTGEDTPENFTTLLGPTWETEGNLIYNIRIEILLSPHMGDQASPRRTPRAANVQESAHIRIKKVLRAGA